MPEHPEPAWSVETHLVHRGRPPAEPGNPVNYPIELSSTYHAGGEIEYARDGALGMRALESAVGPLEGGHAIAYASGMAAANAILDLLPPGAVVVAAEFTYTGVAIRLRELDARGVIQLRRVDIADTEAVLGQLAGADALWIESPTNPMLEVADIRTLSDAAHAQGALVICDNTFATPLLQQPLSLGADVVLHSATKAIGGHSDCLLGLVVARDPGRAEELRLRRTILGAAPGALECYLVLRGLRTLALRLAKSQNSARIIAERLASHPGVTRVRYPGLAGDPGHALCGELMAGPGFMIAIEVAGGGLAATRASESTRLWVHATSLGGVESLLERRRRWAAENPLVPEGLIRLSVGIEDAEDLWADLDQALQLSMR
ncbi:MAG: trans-sulfuration enzyme family protein [Candidatus Nanopelagicales bacterium]